MTPREQLKEAQDRIYKAGGIVLLFAESDAETVPAIAAVHHLLDEAEAEIDAVIETLPRGPEKSGTG